MFAAAAPVGGTRKPVDWVVIDAWTDTMKFNRNSCLRIVGPGWVFSTTVKFRLKTTRIFFGPDGCDRRGGVGSAAAYTPANVETLSVLVGEILNQGGEGASKSLNAAAIDNYNNFFKDN